MPYRDLVEDGHIPGLLVAPDWWEPKHPQETPPDMTDPVALYRPAPEISAPENEGDPEAWGQGACPIAPMFELYQPTTTLAEPLGEGETHVALATAFRWRHGQCVYIQRDDGTWFVSKAICGPTPIGPTFFVNLTTGVVGSGFSEGNWVYIGADGNDMQGGVPWPEEPPPPPEAMLMILSVDRDGTLFMMRTTDLLNWTEQAVTLVPDPGEVTLPRTGLHYADGLWVAVGSPDMVESNAYGTILVSADDGDTWDNASGTLNLDLKAVTYADLGGGPEWVAVGGDAEFNGAHTRSADGFSWTSAISGPSAGSQLTVMAHPSLGALVAGNNGEGWFLHDGGNAFVEMPSNTVWQVVRTSGGRLLSACTGINFGCYWSDNNGAEWTRGIAGFFDAIAHNDAGVVVACNESNPAIFLSTDNGETYEMISGQFPELGINGPSRVIYDRGLGRFIAVGIAAGGQAAVHVSEDGETWTLAYTSLRRLSSEGVTFGIRGKDTL